MATTLAQPSQPPRTITNLAITLTFKTPRTAPTPLRAPPSQGYVLKLPNTFLLQHGSKIRDGLLVLKLVRPNPNPHSRPHPHFTLILTLTRSPASGDAPGCRSTCRACPMRSSRWRGPHVEGVARPVRARVRVRVRGAEG